MAINIYREKDFKSKASLSEQSWNLAEQLNELSKWLEEHDTEFSGEKYIADIGFKVEKRDGAGGGGTLEKTFMEKLIKANIDIHFSEYPD